MKKMVAVLLLFMSNHALSSEVSQGQAIPDLAALLTKVSKLSTAPDSFLMKAKAAWRRKCQARPQNLDDLKPNCMIFESDVLPQGRKDHVLLFRGESETFATSLVSSSLRQALSNESLCPANCTLSTLSNILIQKARMLPRTYEGADYKIAFDEKTQRWERFEGDEDGITSHSPLNIAKGEENFRPITLMKSKHSEGNMLYYVNGQGKLSSFDPYVSFSASPYVAIHFTQLSDGGAVSRLFVASAPLSRIDRSKKCAEFSNPKHLVPLGDCLSKEGYQSDAELEFDAQFFLPSEFLLKVYSGDEF